MPNNWIMHVKFVASYLTSIFVHNCHLKQNGRMALIKWNKENFGIKCFYMIFSKYRAMSLFFLDNYFFIQCCPSYLPSSTWKAQNFIFWNTFGNSANTHILYQKFKSINFFIEIFFLYLCIMLLKNGRLR